MIDLNKYKEFVEENCHSAESNELAALVLVTGCLGFRRKSKCSILYTNLRVT